MIVHRVHHSSAANGPVEAICPRDQDQRPARKPAGFWYSVPGPDDWPSYCEADDGCLTELGVETVLAVDLSKVLVVATPVELHEFTAEFYRPDPRFLSDQGTGGIAWRDVARLWGGIEIAPYQREALIHWQLGWYYGWDCASGCVWDPDVVKILAGMVTP